MKCADCNYCWQDEYDKYPRCHFEGDWCAPCEYDNEYEFEEDCND